MNKLLISTMLKFVLWDERPYVLHEGDLSLGSAHYNGITWNSDNLFVSANIDTKYIIRVFDKNFKSIGVIDNADLRETHQIYWYNNNLYATNTGLNRIEILSDGQWSHFAWNKATCDVDHINGIWSIDDKFFVSEFGNRGEDKNPSKIRICNKNLKCINEFSIGHGIHNVYVEDDIIYTLMSKSPSIVTISEKAQGYIYLPANSSLIRGLARTKNYWYIGVSRWETERDKRHVGDAIVLQLDNGFNEINRIVMPDFGPVCDIRVIDEIDRAHNGQEY